MVCAEWTCPRLTRPALPRLRHVGNGMAGLPFTATITNPPANREGAQETHNDGGSKDWILNRKQCHVKVLEGKGRGVFGTTQTDHVPPYPRLTRSPASQAIPAQTVIETSPVLLFSKEEYENHGRHTLLDHYTFTWRDGRMALALGLGLLFNVHTFSDG
jgi:tRNA-specific adenosine deaminase 3